jgi:hypothetical protein
MYGCQSCGVHEHSLPIKFTRFVRGTLPFTTADVRAAYAPTPRTILLCPSIGELSWLSRPDIVDALLRTAADCGAKLVLKPHAACYRFHFSLFRCCVLTCAVC